MYNAPKAFLITFTPYGTRLHGDDRGTVDRMNNQHGAPYIPPDFRLEAVRRELLKEPPLKLDAPLRGAIHDAIDGHCEYRNWHLHARNVRTNHVHIVVAAADDPEKMMVQFKAYATREMRRRDLIAARKKVWTEGGSKRWLFTDESVSQACIYVLYGQGVDMPMI